MRLSSGVPISGSFCFQNPVGKGSSRQVDRFFKEQIKEQNSFNLIEVKESRHIAGLKDISTPSGTGEAMLGVEAKEIFCIVSLIFMSLVSKKFMKHYYCK